VNRPQQCVEYIERGRFQDRPSLFINLHGFSRILFHVLLEVVEHEQHRLVVEFRIEQLPQPLMERE